MSAATVRSMFFDTAADEFRLRYIGLLLLFVYAYKPKLLASVTMIVMTLVRLYARCK